MNRFNIVLTLTVLLIVVTGTIVHAVPPLPSSFYGTVKINNEIVAEDSIVSAWINDVKYAETSTTLVGSDSVYVIDVPGDDVDTPAIEGGQAGDTIVFRIGEFETDQTAVWSSGTVTEFNLNATVVAPDLQIAKTDDDITATPGNDIIYTLSYSNNGNQDSSGVVMTETVPANTTFNPAASSTGWSCTPDTNAGSTCTYIIGDLTAAASDTITFAVTVADPLPAGVDTVTNTVSIADDGTGDPDMDPTDNAASETTPVSAEPDVQIIKTNGQDTVYAGQNVTYTLTIGNIGTQDATGVAVTDTLPANTTFLTAGDGGSESGGTVTWPDFDLVAGNSVIRTLTIQMDVPFPDGVGTITNSATVADDGSNGPDPMPGNNTSSDIDTVTTPDLTISKDDGQTTVQPGDPLTYTLAISNVGDQPATGVVVTDTLPTRGITFIDASDGGTETGGVVTWPTFDLTAGASITRTVTTQVDAQLPTGLDTLTNTASVVDDGVHGDDPTPEDNTVSDTNSVSAAPDLVISNDDGQDIAFPGHTMTYTLTISNVGTQDATGVTIIDTLSPDTTFLSASDSGSDSGGVVTWPAAFSLATGASVTRTVTVRVDDPLPVGVESITNTATVADDGANGPDPTPENNTVEDSNSVFVVPDLVIPEVDRSGTSTDLQTLTITGEFAVQLKNQGIRDVSDPFQVTIFEDSDLDRAFTPGTDNILGQTIYTDPLLVEQSIWFSIPVSGAVRFRDNLIFAFVDSAEEIVELVEANNYHETGAACQHVQCRSYTSDADFDEGLLVNVNHDAPYNNQLQLSRTTEPFPFINVAASKRGTVVRIDTNTGEIVGEYISAPEGRGLNPSRTTVDLAGNVWTGNRDESGRISGVQHGSVVKIGLMVGGTRVNANGMLNPDGDYLAPPFRYNTCVDRDNDGLIKTSRGLTDIRPWPDISDGVGGTAGIVEDADDECILIYQRLTSAPGVRHISVDANNDVWVGGYPYTLKRFYKLNGNTGAILDSFEARWYGCGGYGGFIDGNNVLWSASHIEWKLLRYDIATGAGTCIRVNRSYGLGIDTNGFIWNSRWSWDSVVKISPAGVIQPGFPKPTYGATNDRGVAVTPADNHIWVANSKGSDVSRLDNDGNLLKVIRVGTTPSGVAVDANGKVWVTNRDSHNVMRIDPNSGSDGLGEVDLTVDLGDDLGDEAFPYNYSDMTGMVALGITAPQGIWSIIHDSGVAGTAWGKVAWNSFEPLGSTMTARVRSAESAAGLGSASFIDISNNVDIDSPDGRYLQLEVKLTPGNYGESPVFFDATVQPFGAPDLTAARLLFTADTLAQVVTMTARIGNGGSEPVSSGIPIAFYDGDPTIGGTLVGVVQTTNDLNPGKFEDVTVTWSSPVFGDYDIFVVADDDGTGTGTQTEFDETNNIHDQQVYIGVDLVISKTDEQVVVEPDQELTYTLTITNTGIYDATGVIITDTLPEQGIVFVDASDGGSETGGIVTWPTFDLAAGASVTHTMTLQVATPLPAGVDALVNTATVADDGTNGPDPTPDDNEAIDTTSVDAAPDLRISKVDSGIPVKPGDALAYTLTYANAGNQDATGVVLTETVPVNTSFNAAASSSGWVCVPNAGAGSTCTFAIGMLAGGTGDTVTFTVVLDEPVSTGDTEIVNTVVIHDDGSNGFDQNPDDNEASATIPIEETNAPPILAPINDQELDEDTMLNVAISASDPDGDSLTLSALRLPAFATLIDNGDGTGVLSLAPDFDDAGTYPGVEIIVSDGSLSDTETFTITVNNVNRPPVADNQTVSTDEDMSVAITLTASDPDEDVLTFVIVSDPGNGTLSGTPPDVTYTPDASYNGPDSFTFQVNDGTVDSNIATVSIAVSSVNDPPVADDQVVNTDEDTSVNITLTASDPEGDPLTFAVVTEPAYGTLSGTIPNLTYTPDTDYFGSDSFTFAANDGMFDSNTATISITVNPVNDPPVLASINDQVLDEGTTLNVVISATDPDGDVISLSASGLPAFATLTDNGDGTGILALAPGFDDAGVYPGVAITASDGNLSDTETFTITVNNVNRPPIAEAGPEQEGDVGTVVLLDGSGSSDPDGDTLNFTWKFVSLPSESLLTQSDLTNSDTAFPSFTPDAAGDYILQLDVSDGQLEDSDTVTIQGTIAQYTLTVEKDGSGTGVVTGDGIDCGSVCAKTYEKGKIIILEAMPDSGSTFESWSGAGCSGTAYCIITITTDTTVTGTFNRAPIPTPTVIPEPTPTPGPNVIPEPTTVFLLGIGLLGLLGLGLRTLKKKKSG